MHTFNHQKFDRLSYEEIEREVSIESQEYQSYIKSLNADEVSEITVRFDGFIPPVGSKIDLYSFKLNSHIYNDIYNNDINILIPNSVFEDDGIDSLSIYIKDDKRAESYTLEQEKPYPMWHENKVTNIRVLPLPKIDEASGTPILYEVELK